MANSITVAVVNNLSRDGFIAMFGDIAENTPWVAERAVDQRPFASRNAVCKAFAESVKQATKDAQLTLICAHPDLAGKAALAGTVTAHSASEQAGAGLDSLSREEFALFERYNAAYLAKFAFPFILAVKGASKHAIIEGFAERLENDAETEFQTAIAQIIKIMRFRLEERIDE